MVKVLYMLLLFGLAAGLGSQASAVETNQTKAAAMQERERVVLTEMIELNRKIHTLRDLAIKQNEFLRRKWERGALSEQEREAATARSYPEVVEMQKRWDELEVEFKALRKLRKAGSPPAPTEGEGRRIE